MKPIYNLSISGSDVELISHDVTLEQSAVGRAFFVVKGSVKEKQIVAFDIGYQKQDGKGAIRFFLGLVERVTNQGRGVYGVQCRELSSVFLANIPLVLRHITMAGVVDTLAKNTGLKIVHSDAEYWKSETPYFYNLGTGTSVLFNLSSVFSVPSIVWQQLPDGHVFVGKTDEMPSSKAVLNISHDVFTPMNMSGVYKHQMVPGLMPGAVINGEKVSSVRLTKNDMVIKCLQQ